MGAPAIPAPILGPAALSRAAALTSTGAYGAYLMALSPTGISVRVRNRPRLAVNMPRWLTALSKWENGTLGRDLRIAFVSSSILADDTQAGTAAQQTSSANACANQLANRGINSACDSVFGTFGGGPNASDVMAFDSRQVFTGSAKPGSQKVQGGASVNMSTTSGSWSYTTRKPATKARVFFRDNTTGRVVAWTATGAAGGNVSSSGTIQVGDVTLDLGASGIKTFTLTWTSGNFDLYGVIFWDDTAGRKNIQCLDMSYRGATSAALADNGTPLSADYGRVNVLAKVAPDVIWLDPGIVNDGNGNVDYDTAEANYRALILAYKAIADVVVMTPPYSAGTGGNSANMQIYVDRCLKVCDELGVAVDDYRSDEESWAKVSTVPGNSWHPNGDVHLGEGPKGIVARRARYALGLY